MNDETSLESHQPITSIDDATDTALTTVYSMWNSFFEHLPFIFGSIVVVLVTWALSASISFFGERLLARWNKRDSVKELIVRLICLLLWVLGLLLAAIVLFPGLTPSRAIGGLGLLSIAVGLAFKDIFENFFAGILILWRFPLEHGDFIECGELTGFVENVLVRMTYIRQTNGVLVVVPNSQLFKNPVKIQTNRPHQRVSLVTGVSYDTNLDHAVSVINDALLRCESVDKKKDTHVLLSGFGSSSLDIEVTWWTRSNPLDIRRSRSEVIIAVKHSLDKAEIEIPFPYRTLTFKNSNSCTVCPEDSPKTS